MKYIKNLLLMVCVIAFIGCVDYKYSINPDGTQIQIGSYVESGDIYTGSHFRWTEKGKLIIEMNEKTAHYYKTNQIK